MPFGCNLSNMKYIQSYADAYDHWHASKRQYNSVIEWAPLDGPKKRHVALFNYGQGAEFRCQFYDTDLATYYADGRIWIRTYDSQSARAFLHRILPPQIEVITAGGTYFKAHIGGEVLYLGQGMSFLHRDPDGKLHLDSTPDRTERTAVKEKMDEARKLLRPFVQWKRSVERLSGRVGIHPAPSWQGLTPALGMLKLGQTAWPELLDYSTESVVRSVAEALKVVDYSKPPLTKPPSKGCSPILCGVKL